MSVTDPDLNEPVAPPSGNGTPPVEEWRQDKNGKDYVPRKGKAGIITRQGEETVAQARDRDTNAPPSERRPRRKTKTPPKPPAPKKVDLRELELALAEGLKAPGIVAAQFGDEWGATHFANAGPYLARNLIVAAQFNPWLKQKLEEAASGQDAMMKVVGIMGIGGALVMYMAPPVIYYLNLPVPDKAREMLNVPDRRDPEPHAPSATSHPAGTPGPGPIAA